MIRTLLLAILLAGCGEEVSKPPVTPLAASDAELQQFYKWGPGPYAPRVERGLEIPHPRGRAQLAFDVRFPQGDGGPWPVLLFSHGNWSTNAKYDELLNHWTSHGYAIVAPLHRDGAGGYLGGAIDMLRYGNLGLIQARVDDLVALLDSLGAVEDMVPGLKGRLDATRVAATGHSFGAFNAQQLGGAAAFDTDSGDYVPVPDERISAVVAISPPGPMFEEITEDSWRNQRLPTLMTTGTWDANALFWPDWRLHKLSFETAVPGGQYALVVQGADHYLGNLIGRPEREAEPQHDALAMVNTAVVAFLDAYVKGDATARRFLRSGRMSGTTARFAVLEHR